MSLPSSAEETASALLDSLELDEAERIGESAGFDLRAMILGWISGSSAMSWNPEEWLGKLGALLLSELKILLPALMVPVLTSMLARMLLGTNERKALSFVCRAGCVAALAASFLRTVEIVRQLMDTLTHCSDAFAPVLIATAALSGAESTVGALTPFTAIAAELLQTALGRWGISAAIAAACVAIAGNLSEHVPLNRLYGLFRQMLQWGVCGMMTAFMGALSVQGRLGAGRDGAAMRSARYAVESILPVVGGNVSESLENVLAATQLVRSAVGVSGMTVLISLFAAPMLRVLSFSLGLKLIAAIAEPIGDGPTVSMLSQFAGAAEMLVIISVAAALLCILLFGSCMSITAFILR